jgi:hypothetical protein
VNMPGFGAKASLYETSENYRGVAVDAEPTARVLPAFRSECERICNLCFTTGSIQACHMCKVMYCPEPGPEFQI